MRVSVVVAVRNEVSHLHRCLEALVRQDYPPDLLELIVVDGHSTDGTQDLLEQYPVRVLEDGGIGVAEARNRGIECASGDVVVFTDGDCVPHPTWVSTIVQRFRADPLLAGVAGSLRMAQTGNVISWFEDQHTRTFYRGFITSNIAYRRDILLEVGGFDPALRCAEDWDLLWRVVDEGYEVAYEPRALVIHAPVEIATWRTYLRKQFWYGRSDVQTFVKRAGRMASRVRRGRAVALRPFLTVLTPALFHAAGAAGLAAGLLGSRRAGAAGAGLLALHALHRTRRAVAQGLPVVDSPWFWGIGLVKGATRGAGALAGVLDELVERLPLRDRSLDADAQPRPEDPFAASGLSRTLQPRTFS